MNRTIFRCRHLAASLLLTLALAASPAVALPARCPADFNEDGQLQVADIFAFLNGWFAGDPSADFNGVPGLQVADIFAFLNDWFAGCP